MKLQVEKLCKRFYEPARGEFFACNEISFEVDQGEIFGLLGPNGAGKTTTLRVISTILKPTSGSAHLGDIDIFKDPDAARRAMGFLSSSTGLYERLTPREILTYFGRLSGVAEPALKEKIESLFLALDFKQYADARCGKLSQGTKQKVSIARAIIHDPKLMIFDEPSTGLDVLATQSMHEFIKQAKGEGKCIVFSTHIMSEAEKLCDRIGIINDGKILAQGTLSELRALTGETYLEEVFMALVRKYELAK
jgi:sodium transport system ATP-binding protein